MSVFCLCGCSFCGNTQCFATNFVFKGRNEYVSEGNVQEFSKFRAFIFPIHRHELKKFLPMSFLMFFILFIYTLVRDLKDIFVQYHTNLWVGASKDASAQLISALKVWYVMPVAFLTVMIFTKLINKFGSQKTFYIIVSSFMVFYAVFGFILYPNLKTLEMSSQAITSMIGNVPAFFHTFLTCAANWPVSMFYVFSEIWGTLAVSSLFWQFANATTMRNEVKRFFGLFSLVANIGVVIAGLTIKGALKDASVNNVRWLMIAVVLVGAAILFIYKYINEKILTDKRFYDPSQIKEKKKKGKVSIMEGLRILFTDKYLLLISILVIGYGMAVNFSEVLMKAQMKMAFTGQQYTDMQSNISIFTGIFTIFVTLFGANILRRCKWKTSALATPVIFLIFGSIFFALTLYNKYVKGATILGISALTLAVWFGVIQNALVKSVKYSLFDSTKNMAYLPLDPDTKTKGQAAVEVVGGRAGKAGAAFIQQIMFAFVAGVMNHAISIIGIYVVTVLVWISSVCGLSPKYEKALAEKEKAAA